MKNPPRTTPAMAGVTGVLALSFMLGMSTVSAAPGAAGATATAGELVVSLDARDPSAGTSNWVNKGSMGNFIRIGAPKLGTNAGQVAVQFNGKSDAYRSEKTTPATITGNHARSIEVWVFNPTLDSTEECMVAWGHRGGVRTNLSFNYGSSAGWSAVTHYQEGDMSWGDESPAAGQWHHLAYTYDGQTVKIYEDGVERGSEDLALGTAAGNKLNLAAENDGETGEPRFESEWEDNLYATSLSGSIAIVRVHSGALTPEQVKGNFAADKARFGATGN